MPDPTEDSFALLDRYRAGDEGALDILMRRQYPRVERIVRVRMRARGMNTEQIADIVQATMLRAIQKLQQFKVREDARLIHWLARIAEREILALNRHRFAARRDEHRAVPLATDSTESPGARPLPATDSTPSQAVSRGEERQVLDDCLASMPEKEREIILLRDYAGASWEFVASELDRPSPDAARKFHEKARANLARMVKPSLDGDTRE